MEREKEVFGKARKIRGSGRNISENHQRRHHPTLELPPPRLEYHQAGGLERIIKIVSTFYATTHNMQSILQAHFVYVRI